MDAACRADEAARQRMGVQAELAAFKAEIEAEKIRKAAKKAAKAQAKQRAEGNDIGHREASIQAPEAGFGLNDTLSAFVPTSVLKQPFPGTSETGLSSSSSPSKTRTQELGSVPQVDSEPSDALDTSSDGISPSRASPTQPRASETVNTDAYTQPTLGKF